MTHTNCQQCASKILEQTAIDNDGICARCKKRNDSKFDEFGLLTELFLGVVLFPFIFAYGLALTIYRRIKFPYRMKEIESQIKRIYPNAGHAKKYARNLVDGYYRPVLVSRTGNPYHLPATEGTMDGSRLVRKEIEFNSLPTRDVVFKPAKSGG